MTPIEKIEKEKLFAILRTNEYCSATDKIKATIDGGINIVEIIVNTSEMIDVVEKTANLNSKPLIMAGGIITERQAQIAINSGADVIVSPVFQMNLVRLCKSRRTPLIMTATTSNEAYSAWKARTQLIKIMPVNPMGGAQYIEDVLRPMDFINVIAAGSIAIDDIPSYLKVGVKAVGIGRALYSDDNLNQITINAKTACKKLLEC